MAAKSQPETQTPVVPASVNGLSAKALEAISALAQANQRVVGELIELSSSAAKEGLRTYAELQSATLDTARTAPEATPEGGGGVRELMQDPFTWYRNGVFPAVDRTRRALKLLEAQAQIVTRSAERFQVTAERTSKEIQGALTSYVSRVKEIYSSN